MALTESLEVPPVVPPMGCRDHRSALIVMPAWCARSSRPAALTKRCCLLELRSRRRARVQGKASLHPAEKSAALHGRQWCAAPGAHPFGARLRLRSAAACAPAIDSHYARNRPNAEPLPQNRWISLARKLPVQERHGYHAASAQVADKAEGRVSAVGWGYVCACRSPLLIARIGCHEMGRHCTPQ